jgi:nitrile hydratase
VTRVDAVTPRFAIGARVRVRDAHPLGHVRTPAYIRGKRGVIERLCGSYANPEELAYARSGLPRLPLYRVRFRQAEIWPGYAGGAEDTLDVEIYQHWLDVDDGDGA